MTDENGGSSWRMAGLVAAVFVVSFLLVAVWMWTAQFSWSSDTWLISMPVLIVLAGIASAVGLIAIFVYRGSRRLKIKPNKPIGDPKKL